MRRIMKYITIVGTLTLLMAGCNKAEKNTSSFQDSSNPPETAQSTDRKEKLQEKVSDSNIKDMLQRVTVEMNGYEITIPQFVDMENEEKEKKVNEIIRKQVKKNIKETGISKEGEYPFHLASYQCKVKRLDKEVLSILVEADGMGEGAAHPLAWAYTINIDLEEIRVLSNEEILPAKYYEKIDKMIMQKCCVDIKNIGYRKFCKKINNGKLLDSKKEWKSIYVYYSSDNDGIGVVIPTAYAIGSYQIYEVHEKEYLDNSL